MPNFACLTIHGKLETRSVIGLHKHPSISCSFFNPFFRPQPPMASSSSSSSSFSSLSFISFLFFLSAASAQLSSTFYDSSCPNALSTIQSAVNDAVASESRMGASLLRLHFHDCFVNGCDGSVLLDDTATFTGEKAALPNANSVRGFDVIDNIKSQVEAICSQTVSCADILAVAARDSVVALGGPSWTVKLGRRDSTTASLSGANSDLPGPNLDLSALISAFSNKGLSATDLVALLGAHSIGKARCLTFRGRIYNETNIDSSFATSLQANCPSAGGDSNLADLDVQTPTTFDNAFYVDLVNKKGLLHADQQLFNGGSTDSQVSTYSSDANQFASDFTAAMVNMADIDPLTGSQGEIRIDCRKIN